MVTLTPSGGTALAVVGATPSKADWRKPINDPIQNPVPINAIGLPALTMAVEQVVGLSPLFSCTEDECREICYCTFRLRVFGNLVGGIGESAASYENDISSFLINTYWTTTTNATIVWKLQEYDRDLCTWSDLVTLTDNTYGTLYEQNCATFQAANHPSYSGFQINWGKVLQYQGAGIYRIKVNSTYRTSEWCSVSHPYELRQFHCNLAHGTVKWESWLTGKIGDPYEDYKLHDICGMSWYDSIRVNGFFGYHKIPQYLENLVEWGKPKSGLIERVNDEAIQQYEYKGNYMPQFIYDRLGIFAFMSDTLYVSDYNKNNSDYTLIRKHVVKAGSFEPEYVDKNWVRRSKVSVLFRRGVQNVIKTNCCEVIRLIT